MTTKQQVEQLAAKLGVTITVRPGAGGFSEIVATAPDGSRFDAAHEVISQFVPGVKGDKEKAWQDTLADLQHVQPCTDPNCDWCNEDSIAAHRAIVEKLGDPNWADPRDETEQPTFKRTPFAPFTDELHEAQRQLHFGSIRTVTSGDRRAQGDFTLDLHGIVHASAPMVMDSAHDWVVDNGGDSGFGEPGPVAKAIAANMGWGLHDGVDCVFNDGSTRGWSPVILGDLPDEGLALTRQQLDAEVEASNWDTGNMDWLLFKANLLHNLSRPEFAQRQHTQLWAPDGSIERIDKQNGSDTGAACVARVEDVPREYTQHSSYAAWFTHHAIPAQTVWVKHLPAVFGRGSDDFAARYQTVVDDANYQAHFGGVGYGDDPSGRALIGKPDEVTLGFGGGYGPSWSKLLHGLVAATVRGATFELTAAGHALLDGQVCAHCGAELKPGWDGGENVYTYTVEVLTEARPDASYVPARYTSYHQVIAGGPFVCCAACMDEATKPQPDDPKPGETIWVDGRQTKVRGVHGEGLCYDLEESTRCGHYGATLPRSEWPERLRYATADMCDECVGQVGRLCGHECRPVEQPVDINDPAHRFRIAIEGALDLGLASFTDQQNGSTPAPEDDPQYMTAQERFDAAVEALPAPSHEYYVEHPDEWRKVVRYSTEHHVTCGEAIRALAEAKPEEVTMLDKDRHHGFENGRPAPSLDAITEPSIRKAALGQLPIHTHDEHDNLVPKQYRAFAKGVEVWLVTYGAEPTRTGTISRSVWRTSVGDNARWVYGFAPEAMPKSPPSWRFAADLAKSIADGDYELRMPQPPGTDGLVKCASCGEWTSPGAECSACGGSISEPVDEATLLADDGEMFGVKQERMPRTSGKASVTAKQPLADESWQERNFEVDQTGVFPYRVDQSTDWPSISALADDLGIDGAKLGEQFWRGEPCAECGVPLQPDDDPGGVYVTAPLRWVHAACLPQPGACEECADGGPSCPDLAKLQEQLLRTQSALETERRSVEAWKKVANASREEYHELTAQLAAEVDHKYDGYPDGVVALVDALHEWMTEGGDNPAPLHAGALLFDDDHSLQEHVTSCYELLHRQNGSVLAVPPLAELQRDLAKLDWELVAAWRIHEHARGYRLTYVILAKRRQPVFPEAPYVVSHWSGGDTLPSGFGGSRYDLTAERGAEVFTEEARENWV